MQHEPSRQRTCRPVYVFMHSHRSKDSVDSYYPPVTELMSREVGLEGERQLFKESKISNLLGKADFCGFQ